MGIVNQRMEEIIKREEEQINRSYLRDFVKEMRHRDMKNELQKEKYIREKLSKSREFTDEELELLDDAFRFRLEYLKLSDIEKL